MSRYGKRWLLAWAAPLAAVGIAVGACAGGGQATPTMAPQAQPTATRPAAVQPTAAPTSPPAAQPTATRPTPTATTAPAPTAGGAPAAREVAITAKDEHWSIAALTVKAGERVGFRIKNEDDDPHNLIGPTAGLAPGPMAPDIGPKREVSYTWVVGNSPGSHDFICMYHPEMVIKVTIQS